MERAISYGLMENNMLGTSKKTSVTVKVNSLGKMGESMKAAGNKVSNRVLGYTRIRRGKRKKESGKMEKEPNGSRCDDLNISIQHNLTITNKI